MARPRALFSDGIFTKALGNAPVTVPLVISRIAPFAFAGFPADVTLSADGQLAVIGTSAFAGSCLVRIVIPRSVVNIGAAAFRGSHSLASVEFASGSSLERIEEFAFEDTALEKLELPERLAFFAGSAVDQLIRISLRGNTIFAINNSLLLTADQGTVIKAFGRSGELEIQETVSQIGSFAFSGLRTLTQILFKGKSLQIGESAFIGTAVRVLELPPDAIVDPKAFEGIQTVMWNPKDLVIREALNYDGPARTILFSSKLDVLVRCFARARTIIIPAFVEEIGRAAFLGVETVRAVECQAGSSLKVINDEGFARSGLRTILLPPSLVEIRAGAIPLDAEVELEAGLATEADEDEFAHWVALRKAGDDAKFSIH